MISQKTLFLQHVGQTSACPLALEIVKAEGIYIHDVSGKKYIDLVSGVSVNNVGHCNPKVVKAVKEQAEKYMHLMVYGEYVQEPQVKFAKKIIDNTPDNFDSVYFVNSGSEAIEGAMKLAKRYTGRREMLAFEKAYHGSTHGALSIYGGAELTKAVQPLLPEVGFMKFNDELTLNRITEKTACVIMEVIQAEGGIINADTNFLQSVRKKCDEVGALLVFDEIQTGFGRTGKLFAFEHYGVVPDILCLAKGMGGGMPIGAFVASKEIMDTLTVNPALGHITTFGGHPVSCAAGLAALEVVLDENLIELANIKGDKIRKGLKHNAIDHIRGKGLFLAVELKPEYNIDKFLDTCLEVGLVFDLFLFNRTSFRIAPPLTVTDAEIDIIIDKLLKALNTLT